jgi:hypothetical protein
MCPATIVHASRIDALRSVLTHNSKKAADLPHLATKSNIFTTAPGELADLSPRIGGRDPRVRAWDDAMVSLTTATPPVARADTPPTPRVVVGSPTRPEP